MFTLCSTQQLDLEHTLVNGQAFRWRLDPDGWWSCILCDRSQTTPSNILVRLRHDGNNILGTTDPPGYEAFVRDYLRLDIDLISLTQNFAALDTAIVPSIQAFPGLRVLRQDPVECLFSFLCTSAAPLHRIRRSVEGLSRTYGASRPAPAGADYYSFPSIDDLASASVEDMKALGLGYRARYVKATAIQLQDLGGADYLLDLRTKPYADAKAGLLPFTGIGEKIADCICLFSMDKDEAIPVDTHIRQIVERHYLPSTGAAALRTKTPSYAYIGDLIRNRFGPMAGWAQQYLFFEDLFEKRAWGAFQSQWTGEA